MASLKPKLQVIGGDDLQDYPIAADERLESHFFIPWHFNRWLNSDFRLKAEPDVRAFAFDLFCISQNQTPVGTLPNDDELLARLLLLDVTTWKKLKRREPSPMHGWTLCKCGDQTRWMHKVVLEMAEGSLTKKKAVVEARERDRERKRHVALKGQMLAAGAHSALVDNDSYVERLDHYMLEHCKGNRTPSRVREAMFQSKFNGEIKLPFDVTRRVVSVKYWDASNSEVTLDAASYNFYGRGAGRYIGPVSGSLWPSVYDRPDAVKIEFEAGHENVGLIPKNVVQAGKLLLGHYFENRSAVVVGAVSKELELGVGKLVGRYIRYGV